MIGLEDFRELDDLKGELMSKYLKTLCINPSMLMAEKISCL